MDGKISFFYIVLLSFEGEASSLMSKTFIPGKRLVRNWFCGALQTKPVYKPVFPEIGITRAGAYARTHKPTQEQQQQDNSSISKCFTLKPSQNFNN